MLLPDVLSRLTAPAPRALSCRTARAAADRSGTTLLSARSLASPAANAHHAQRSRRALRLVPRPALPPKHPPTTLLPRFAALHSRLLLLRLFARARAALSG